MRIEITENIFCIKTRNAIRKVVLEYKDSRITRQLYIKGDSISKNNKIDVIDCFKVSFEDIEKLSPLELGMKLKKDLEQKFKEVIDSEICFFYNPKLVSDGYSYLMTDKN